MTLTNKESTIQNAIKENKAVSAAKRSPATMMRNVLNLTSSKQLLEETLKNKKEVFIASLIDLYSSDSTLAQCDPAKVMAEALKAASLDLSINRQLGFAYIIPYRDGKTGQMMPQFQLGYKGYIQLALKSRMYKYINAGEVYEGQLKNIDMLTGVIDFDSDGKVSDRIIGYFAHIETHDGFCKTIYRTVEDIRKHASKYSKTYKSGGGAWKDNFDAMAIKTVLRELLSKWSIMSIELQQQVSKELAVEADNAIIADDGAEVVDAESGEVI